MTNWATSSVSADDYAATVANEVGRALMEAGKLNENGFHRAMALLNAGEQSFPVILSKLGLVSEADVAAALAEAMNLDVAGTDDFPEESPLVESINTKFLRAQQAAPLGIVDGVLRLAMADPSNRFAASSIELSTGLPVQPVVAIPSEIESALQRRENLERAAGVPAETTRPDEPSIDDVNRLREIASEAPVVRLVAHTIEQAVLRRASDIHFEPFDTGLRIRYRIDGVLVEADRRGKDIRAAVISRIKILARLDIAEQRLPQDGRMRATVRGDEIDFRVATAPSVHGERIVLRILDRRQTRLDFESLGFSKDEQAAYQNVLERPFGILLVTGPTGSGKTTTLYSSLARLNRPDINILTVEDPVEYELEGVSQVNVKPDIKLTFASVLRSFLRHDPDVIMVGEIRDLETAQIAVQASLTGHLVLSTLHTNDATSAIARLVDMGIEEYLLAATINGVVAQRLVRRLCMSCREEYRPSNELANQLHLDRRATLYRAVGCEACNGSGYSGRIAVLEILDLGPELKQLVLSRADAATLRAEATRRGMTPLFEAGLAKAKLGLTSLEEVFRVARS